MGQATSFVPIQDTNTGFYCFGDFIPGATVPNSVPKCLNAPPSNATYGNVYVKNVCLSQLPFEQWGQYASLSNKFNTTPVTTTNFTSPAQGQTSSFDLFERHWMGLPMHTAQQGGGTLDGNDPSLGAYMANPDGSMVKGPPYGNYNYYYGYRARNPTFVSQMQTGGAWN